MALMKAGLGSDQGYRRRPIRELEQKSLARPLDRFLRSDSPYRLDRDGHADQRNRLHHMVRRVAKGAALVIYLSVGVRVRDLNKPGQQDKRNAEDPEPTGPGPLKALFVYEYTHVLLDYKAQRSNRKTAEVYIDMPNCARQNSNRQKTRVFRRFLLIF
jgi:hypothetical protein